MTDSNVRVCRVGTGQTSTTTSKACSRLTLYRRSESCQTSTTSTRSRFARCTSCLARSTPTSVSRFSSRPSREQSTSEDSSAPRACTGVSRRCPSCTGATPFAAPAGARRTSSRLRFWPMFRVLPEHVVLVRLALVEGLGLKVHELQGRVAQRRVIGEVQWIRGGHAVASVACAWGVLCRDCCWKRKSRFMPKP